MFGARVGLNQYLETLEISIDEFENYSYDDLKRHYHSLVKKYHPDIHVGNYFARKMADINNAMNTINKMMKNGSIILKKSSDLNKNYQKDEENSTIKENENFIDLFNRLDKLSSNIIAKKNMLVDKNQIAIINKSLVYYKEILDKIKIICDANTIYDYGIILNYVELFEYFYSNTLHINSGYTFDYNHSNHIKNGNDKIEILKDKLCLIHKQLLLNEVKIAIRCFNEYKMCDKDIIKTIDDIDKEIINLKWYMCLNIFDFNIFEIRVKKIVNMGKENAKNNK